MAKNYYRIAEYLTSAAKIDQLPPDDGFEVAFAGRSNAGKSSVLNCITDNKQLARTSKTPGRTQLINLFAMDDKRRLVDLPGYGYAKVPKAMKENWQKTLIEYLQVRQCLKGMILLMDIRHPLKEHDTSMLHWAIEYGLPTHILLTKSDKLKRGAINEAVKKVKQTYELADHLVSVQPFSSLKKDGMEQVLSVLDGWYEL